jgi:hypothetical protein
MAEHPARARLKPIALPAEHGSWGFLLEPLLLGLCLAPTPPGIAVAAGVFAVFLLRNPLRIFLRGRPRAKASPRRSLARTVWLVYAAVAAAAVAVAVSLAGWTPLWPLVTFAPLGAAFLLYDSRNQGRSLGAELSGGVGLAAATPAIVMCGGWGVAPAMTTWAIVLLKAVPTVLYVRARLRLEDGGTVSPRPAAAAHAAAVALGVALAARSAAPWLSVAMLVVLFARARLGLSRARWGRTTKQIGVLEFVFSGLYVLANALGYRLAL